MTNMISDTAVALSLMREALTLLDEPANAEAAGHIREAISALERQNYGQHEPAPSKLADDAPPDEGF